MPRRFTGLWRHSEFRRYWTASAISDVGSQVTALALPLIGALTLAATPWQMGVLNAASSMPILLVGLFAGVWVDRLRRRPVLIAADIGRAVLLLTIPLASLLGVLTIELLVIVALVVGALGVFFDVAHLAFLPVLVARDQLVDGNAKLEVTAAAAQVVGPSFGGALIGLLGAPFAVLLDALSFLASGWLIKRTRAVEPAPAATAARASVCAEIREGFRVVWAEPILRALIAAAGTMNFFGRMFLAVYVLYMTRDLGLGPIGVGLVLATGGIGSLAGALVTGPTTRRFGPGPMLVASQLAFGLTGLLVPLAILFPRVALVMIVASEFGQWMAVIVYYVNAVSVRQTITPSRLQGRVNATMRFFAGGLMPIGALVGGALGGVIGLPWTLVVAEIGTLLGFVWLVFSPVRSLRALPSAA
ncbi:MAG: MFS transporter [Candidatus Rokubacteria bacterium]|nr:MFS transporter [Candidatus Rokubacteria bacterium]